MSQTLEEAVGEVFAKKTVLRRTRQIELLSALRSSNWDDIFQWDEIPSPLTDWIQRQDGLKINHKPISSTDDLIRAHYLLWIKGDPLHQSLMQVFFKVADGYIPRVRKRRRTTVQDLIIPGLDPYHIMVRKCSNCGERVLDDAFACFAKNDATIYIAFYRSNGCRLPSCGKGIAELVPVQPTQKHRRAAVGRLENIKKPEWKEYLLRCSDGLQGMPEIVKIK